MENLPTRFGEEEEGPDLGGSAAVLSRTDRIRPQPDRIRAARSGRRNDSPPRTSALRPGTCGRFFLSWASRPSARRRCPPATLGDRSVRFAQRLRDRPARRPRDRGRCSCRGWLTRGRAVPPVIRGSRSKKSRCPRASTGAARADGYVSVPRMDFPLVLRPSKHVLSLSKGARTQVAIGTCTEFSRQHSWTF